MILKAFSLRDTKGETFGAPIFVPTEGVMIRLLPQLASDQRTDLGKFPDDFLLYSIGEYNTATAVMTPAEISLVCSVSSTLKKSFSISSCTDKSDEPRSN